VDEAEGSLQAFATMQWQKEKKKEKECQERWSPPRDHKPGSPQTQSSSDNYYTAKFFTRNSLFNIDSCILIKDIHFSYGNYTSTATAVFYLQRL